MTTIDLDLHIAPITGDRLRKIRKALPKRADEVPHGRDDRQGYPSQTQMSDRMGLPPSTWDASSATAHAV